MTLTPDSDPGLSGYIVSVSTTASAPESLRRVAAALTNRGFTTTIWRGVPATLWHGLDVRSMNTGWLLTWSRATATKRLVGCGSLWVADGAEGLVDAMRSTSTPG